MYLQKMALFYLILVNTIMWSMQADRLQHFTFFSRRTLPSLRQITPPMDHTEGPTWDHRKNCLYFVDIHAGNVFSYDHFSGDLHAIQIEGDVTPVIPSKNKKNSLFIGVNRTLYAVKWDGRKILGESRPLVTVSNQFPLSRFNDGKADSQGRLWLGTMGFENAQGVAPHEGYLYKFTKKNYKSPEVMLAPVNISNGLAWNRSNTKFYYIDSPTRKVMEYDYDDLKGSITNGHMIFDMAKHSALSGVPDGMTIDEEDNLWIALFGGGAVAKISSKTGKVLQVVHIPVRDVTSVMWGGPQLDVLYVTTSRVQLGAEQRRQYPAAGSVFAVYNLGMKGRQSSMADIL